MKTTFCFGLIFFLILGCTSKKENSTTHEPTAADIQKMSAAVPDKPSAQPKKPRKVLVFSLAWGYKHGMIPWGKKLFALIGKKSGAFEAVVSDDIAMFEPENIGQFDAIIFNNTNNEIFLPKNFDSLAMPEQNLAREVDKRLKASLVNFLQSGKGLAVFHAGVASFRQWPEFGKIIGARFDNHPWVAGSTVTLKVDEPDHPLVQAFTGKSLQVTDEIYQMKEPYSRAKLRVLLSIDTGKTDMTVKGIHRTDGDFAMSWIKTYGQGRIFYNAFGHQKHVYWDPVIVRHWLDGIQFVLGDLPADATPSGKVDATNK